MKDLKGLNNELFMLKILLLKVLSYVGIFWETSLILL